MTKKRKSNMDQVLDQDVLQLLGGATASTEIDAERKLSLRSKVFASLDESVPNITIRASEGRWVEIEPLLEKKLLNIDENGIESYLLRLHPGAAPSRHTHHSDELCIVLEGEVAIGDLQLAAGDCHIARKGSLHRTAHSVNGALLFLQSAVHPAQPQTI